MPTIRTFHVRPVLPDVLRPLQRIANNLWWCWNHGAIDLFQRLDPDLWDELGHNPLKLLGRVSQTQLEAAAADDGFVAHLEGVERAFDAYMDPHASWYARTHERKAAPDRRATPAELWPDNRIAYFSAEFGLSESVPIYSGGLGILAGDHLKSASDLGVPLVAIGMLYREAFHQQLNADGWQQDLHPETDVATLPVQEANDADGRPLVVRCSLPGRTLHAKVWRMNVGRVPLFLLDTNLPDNSAEDQRLTDRLYGGDLDVRIRQEILLGIGGMRALEALNLAPAVCHMNEGHSAFLALERIRRLRQERGLSFEQARVLASASHAFTTHTPVPAGNDRFPPEMIDQYFSGYREELGLSRHDFLALGREDERDEKETFCMTVLALKLSDRANGVSRLHGRVSRSMWRRVYPGVPEQEIPIESITNGVHQRSFLSADMRRLFESYLGPKWLRDPGDPTNWERVERIPAEELWRVHERRRAATIAFARARLRLQVERRGGGRREISATSEVLDPSALTIGFARRFATYKRAGLIFRDVRRLAALLNNPERPVQLLFAGKAHQRDEPGKALIRRVVHQSLAPELRHRVVFLEDYDMNVARYLVQGVDVWLNTPARPYEASGTSGMKVVVNGGLHLSVLDGWWAEAYEPDLGWAIGNGEEYVDQEVGDRIESEMLYHLLENEIVPLFYERSRDGLPRGWIEMMKASIGKLGPVFTTDRMVREYHDRFYAPSIERTRLLSEDDGARGRELAAYRERVRGEWHRVKVVGVDSSSADISIGDGVEVTARVELGALRPDEVSVQAYYGTVDARGDLHDGVPAELRPAGRTEGSAHVFSGPIRTRRSGRFGFAVRVLPRNPLLASPFGLAPVIWD